MGHVFLDVKEMYRLAAPLEIVDELVRRVALFEDESVVQKLPKLVDYVDVLVVRDPTRELS